MCKYTLHKWTGITGSFLHRLTDCFPPWNSLLLQTGISVPARTAIGETATSIVGPMIWASSLLDRPFTRHFQQEQCDILLSDRLAKFTKDWSAIQRSTSVQNWARANGLVQVSRSDQSTNERPESVLLSSGNGQASCGLSKNLWHICWVWLLMPDYRNWFMTYSLIGRVSLSNIQWQ